MSEQNDDDYPTSIPLFALRFLVSVLLATLLMTCGAGCQLTLPNGVAFEGPRRAPYEAPGDPIIAAEAERCTARINGLISKARAARNGTYALTLGGGGIAAGSGVTGAFLTKDEDKAKVSAAIAATGGIVAVVGTLLASPGDVVAQAEGARSHWNAAEAGIRAWAREPVDHNITRTTLLDAVLVELKACGDS